MTATCSCPPDDCHGGHTINVGPSWVSIPDDRLRQFRDDPNVCTTASERSMAAELLALRARVTTMAALFDAESERGRQREPIGFAVVRRPIGDGAAAVVWSTLDQARTAEGIASGYAIHPTVAEAISSVGRSDQPAGSDLVLVELREVTE